MYKPREVSESVNIHLGDGVVEDLYLLFAYLYFLFMFLKNIHYLCCEKQAVCFERNETSSQLVEVLGSERVRSESAGALALPSLCLVGYLGV